MKTFVLCLTISIFSQAALAQDYSSSAIFAHNDYLRKIPFFTAYDLNVGYIEADVFLSDNDLLVAHTKIEINKDKTLERLYLDPLAQKVADNNGFAYADKNRNLTLMIDLKTDGEKTLKLLIEKMQHYPSLVSCRNLTIMISGNVPDPARWKNYPFFIHVDGRPGIVYSSEQLDRISMISTNFNTVSKWNGKGEIPEADKQKIISLMADVHSKGKPVRFWATPDFPNAWEKLIELKLDVIVTDEVVKFSNFVR